MLAGRFVAIVRALMPAAAGAAGVRYRSFTLHNILGGVIWGVGYSLLGYLAGSAYAVVARRVGTGLAIAIAVLIVAVVAVVLVRRHRPRPGRGAARRARAGVAFTARVQESCSGTFPARTAAPRQARLRPREQIVAPVRQARQRRPDAVGVLDVDVPGRDRGGRAEVEPHHAHRVYQQAAADPGRRPGGRLGGIGYLPGGGDPDRVLDRPGAHQRDPVLLLVQPRRPRRGHHEQLRAARGQRPGQLGEADVVAGQEADPEAGQVGEHEVIARRDGVGLPVPERVEQMDLAVRGRQLAVGVEADRGVEHPTARPGLENARDHRYPGGARDLGQPRAERTVDRLGQGAQVGGEAGLSALGEDREPGALGGGVGDGRPDPVQVGLRDGADGELSMTAGLRA